MSLPYDPVIAERLERRGMIPKHYSDEKRAAIVYFFMILRGYIDSGECPYLLASLADEHVENEEILRMEGAIQ